MRRLPEVTTDLSAVVVFPVREDEDRGHHAEPALVTAVFGVPGEGI